jgi:hypothetical protein
MSSEGHDEEFYLLGYDSVYSRENQSTELCLLPGLRCFFSLVHSSTLKREAICPSEKPVIFHSTTQRYIPEGRILQAQF